MVNATAENETESAVFQTKLEEYKKVIDADIAEYVEEIKDSTLREFGLHSRIAADVYCSILQRGGKRLRGSLVMAGYEMCGGKNLGMIIKAARAAGLSFEDLVIRVLELASAG